MIKSNRYRTHHCSDICKAMVGKVVKVSGWVSRKRMHGGLVFIDLRDCSGIAQCKAEDVGVDDGGVFSTCEEVSQESVIEITGTVKKRPAGAENSELHSGTVEIKIEAITILSRAKELPFSIHQDTAEELKLRYRYLDLRRPQMSDILKLRASVTKEIRLFMEESDFMEVHTPLFTCSSSEGARDYVVPSRLHPGEFYALPQSPQIYKQLLMVGGVEKYYQIAPCFRDEDGRADRAVGPFYQIDMEMAFADQEQVIEFVEDLISKIFQKFGCLRIAGPFTRMVYSDAMRQYGSDKPDLCNPLKFHDFSQQIKSDPQLSVTFADALQHGHIAILPIAKLSEQSRKFFDTLKEMAVSKGAKDIGYIIFSGEGVKGSLAKIFNTEMQVEVKKLLSEYEDGAILVAHSDKKQYYNIISAIRNHIGEALHLIDKHIYKFCWITDINMFEKKEDGQWTFAHNPFSMPKELGKLSKESVADIMGCQYDLVCNGYELCSGAVRNFDVETMYKVFELVDLDRDYVNEHFSCMISAFNYGPPPHAGCAIGLERLLMLLGPGISNIRQVIPFPLTQSGIDLLTHTPAAISKKQLEELGIFSPEKQKSLLTPSKLHDKIKNV